MGHQLPGLAKQEGREANIPKNCWLAVAVDSKYVKLLIAILLLIVPEFCPAQEVKEQLYTQPAHHQVDTSRIKALYQLGLYYLSHYNQKNHLDSAQFYLNKALLMATAAHRSTEINRCNLQLGNVYLARNNLPVAERYYTLVAQAHEARLETAKQAQTWLKFGENVLNKMTDTGKKKPELAAEMAEKYYSRGLRLLETTKDTGALIDREIIIASSFGVRGFDERYKKKSIDIIKRFENSSFARVNVLYASLSQFYRDAGNNNVSLFYLLKAMNRMNRLRDTVNKDLLYGELALIYDELGQTDKSIEMYKETLALREKIPGTPPEALYRTVGFMVLDLNKLGRSAEGLSYLINLEKRHPPKEDNVKGMAAQVKAYCYDGLKQYRLAEKFYLVMMTYYRNCRINYLREIASYDIANFYLQQKKYSKAAYYLKALQSVNFNLSRERNINLMRFKIDSAAGKPWSAIKYFQQYKRLNDSIFNATKSGQIEELQIKYATEQKESDLVSVTKDRQLQYEKANHATNARNITLIGIGMLLIVVGLLYNSYRINQKKTIEIDRKNKELSQLVSEKDSLLEEKEWLIKEVHHRVKNNLQIVMSLLQRQSSFINNKEALAAIRNSEHRMHSIALIHQKLYQSDSLMLVNMNDYINDMVGYLQECFDLGNRIRFEKLVADINFEVNVAVPMGLILNEAITNSIKYAFNGHRDGYIRIALEQTGENDYLLAIADNGRGLAVDIDLEKMNSMGFNLMRGLSKQLGGKLSVSNDHGLVIKIAFRTR
ncbi:histidine kinase dimerization/phosphoacceptor domain -containing protein [Mucilaginibacter sp. KACC 22773]|uniref:tetratricopeptide repeat-containing sensor histidine kinase n=1 Tax=Mucilaginibacter sp. KACC 22773 TaxID=3025671 RepID=UPI002365AB7F|nr:histidine kinase dimerization/phosphoacceptor domain -containing protein [Mucilaginibacter sp. KACC 22773]WDF75749.1 histidine kinase dimerization/phosphoacceptor domain -containing protein [Mucilaginibacter sp. KACC 22773]